MAYRVPYDVSGICSFQLVKLFGDVHPNPGPFLTGKKVPPATNVRSPSEVTRMPSCVLCAINGFTQDA